MPPSTRIRLVPAILLLGLLAAGCGSSSRSSSPATTTRTNPAHSTTTASTSTSTTGTGAPTPTTTRGGSIEVTDGDNGRTIQVHPDTTVTVILHSTLWPAPTSGDPRVAHQTGTKTEPKLVGCVPGSGCGTVTTTFVSTTPGATIIATDRTTCGEAMRCQPDQGHWQITLSVLP